MSKKSLLVLFAMLIGCVATAQTRHSKTSAFPNYEGLVMAGYQGWFRAEGDGANEGWGHYAMYGKVDSSHIHTDLWPDVSEYEKTYPTQIKHSDGSVAKLFSSWDKSTTLLHFKWMKEYGVDGVFMQRFFGGVRTPEGRRQSNVILKNALEASKINNRAIAVMYDLSGLKDKGEDCSAIIDDWKQLVDSLKITSGGDKQTYLYHHNKPLVAIWGLGFPDRGYNIRNIGIDRLIDFLKNDPVYGGCAVMLGVPTYFRDLNVDCLPDPYLHQIMKKADIILPWMVQRFTPLLQAEGERYAVHVKADIAWCTKNKLDYVPCISPGFSWYNLGKVEFNGLPPLGQIPRQKGQFYWEQISNAIGSGAKMIYIAMFDEMDEGTAIFKCTNNPPIGTFKLLDYEGMPTDHYLWLTGKAGAMLKKQIPFTKTIPQRNN
ncbi:MAG: glycoside hydrolase family 71/99-like protein [Bacteroidota bacterium]